MIVPIIIPPLRERREDIMPLAAMFLEKFNKKYGSEKVFTASAVEELNRYSWPGNVRELRNTIERLVVMGESDAITGFQVKYCNIENEHQMDVSCYGRGKQTLSDIVCDYEKQIVMEAMEVYGTVSATAKNLGIDKGTLSRKLKKYREREQIDR